MKPISVIIIAVLTFVLGGVLAYYFMPKETITHTINEAIVDSTSIIQDARIGWIPVEELDKLITSATKAKKRIAYVYKDSLRIKDSLVIKDSLIITYIPYYFADTTLTFKKDDLAKGYEFSADVYLQTKFYPTYEKFQTDAMMRNLNINIVYQQPWKFDYMSGGWGFAAGAIFTGGIVYLTKQGD